MQRTPRRLGAASAAAACFVLAGACTADPDDGGTGTAGTASAPDGADGAAPAEPPSGTPTQPSTGSASGTPAQPATEPPSGASVSPTEDRTATRSLTFIAMGDDGARGAPIGCGDSAVTVPHTTTTIAPLGEVYRAELAASGTRDSRGEHYRDTELYNALYRSDLHYEGADIDDGHADVDLTGTLRMGGECDIPRVRAQLTRPALQFGNVDSVTVRIDGQELDGMLSLRD